MSTWISVFMTFILLSVLRSHISICSAESEIIAKMILSEIICSLPFMLRSFLAGRISRKLMWSYKTPKGTFHIIKPDAWFHIIYDGEDLGSYATPEQAADDLAGGHTFSPSNGVDPGELEISDDLGDWKFTKPKA
jgi:hypothetical protein